MQVNKQTKGSPVLAYSPHHRAIAHVLTRKYKKGVVIETNRRLMDVVGKEDRPPALKNPVTSRPVAAIGYSKASYQIIVIVAFMDEWKGGARKKLQRFCWESVDSFVSLRQAAPIPGAAIRPLRGCGGQRASGGRNQHDRTRCSMSALPRSADPKVKILQKDEPARGLFCLCPVWWISFRGVYVRWFHLLGRRAELLSER